MFYRRNATFKDVAAIAKAGFTDHAKSTQYILEVTVHAE
jgi:hypothetical protein